MKFKFYYFILLIFYFVTLGANMLVDMGVMIGGQVGASIANQFISSEFQDMMNALTTSQTNLQNALQDFTNTVQTLQKSELQELLNLFAQAQKQVASMNTEQQKLFQEMQNYVQKYISLDVAQSQYLASAPIFDQLFSLGTMLTPHGRVWKNPFQVGNWQYNENSNSFWQMSQTSLVIPGTNSSAPNPANNYIFTEYFSKKASYEIWCDLTIYQTSYPFFVGIICNYARWISGDMNALYKYRLIGIYGKSSTDIGVYFAEQITQNITSSSTVSGKTQSSIIPTPVPALQQILSGSIQPKITLSSTVFTNLRQTPATFSMRIITSINTVQFKIWPKGTQEPNSFIIIKNLQPDLYLYHGIGFISPGALSQFNLQKPSDILFSKKSQTEFATQMKNLISTNNSSLASQLEEKS